VRHNRCPLFLTNLVCSFAQITSAIHRNKSIFGATFFSSAWKYAGRASGELQRCASGLPGKVSQTRMILREYSQR
jgi:hypothetical protein